MVTVALRSHSGWGSSGVNVFWTVQWGLAWDRQLLMLKAEDPSWIKGQRKERPFIGDELKEEKNGGLRRQDFVLCLQIQVLTQRKAASLSASCPLWLS